MSAYRIHDEQPTRSEPNLRAAWVFVVVMFVLLSNPLLDSPLPVRIGRVVVWLLAQAGVDVGPLVF